MATQDFLEKQNTIVNSLYDFSPSNDSLFFASMENEMQSYLVKSISYTLPTVKTERDDIRRQEFITGFEGSNKVSITFYEDQNHSVEKFYMRKLNDLYNFQYGTFRTGYSPITKLSIERYMSYGSSSNTQEFKLENKVTFHDLIPIGNPKLDFDTSSGSDLKTIEIEFSFGYLEYGNYKNFN